MALLRAVFFDMGGTLVHGPDGDPWRAVVIPRIQEAFPSCGWADELYETDLWKLASPQDPLRQETKRWIGDWLRERGHTFSEEDVERLRAAARTASASACRSTTSSRHIRPAGPSRTARCSSVRSR